MDNIFICGIPGSGKGLLRTLLDGHSEVVTSPFQAFGYGLISPEFSSRLLSDRPYNYNRICKGMKESLITINNHPIAIGEIVGFLFPTISKIIDASISKKIYSAPSQEREVFVNFEFSYDLFIKKFINNILSKEGFNYTINNIFNIFVSEFLSEWSNKNNSSKSKYFSQSSANGIEVMLNILNSIDNSKILLVNRDPVSMIYTNTKRVLRKKYDDNNYKKIVKNKDFLYIFNTYSKVLFSRPYAQKINKLQSYILNNNDPRVFVVDFEDLVFDTTSSMSKVCKFLNIEPENINNIATLNSNELEKGNIKYTGIIHDGPSNNLSYAHKLILNNFLLN
jgi:hypothetical protein